MQSKCCSNSTVNDCNLHSLVLLAFAGVASVHEPSPKPIAYRSPTHSHSTITGIKQSIFLSGGGGGQVVSMIALHSDNMSSNRVEVYRFILLFV